jgi:hypothetical protein
MKWLDEKIIFLCSRIMGEKIHELYSDLTKRMEELRFASSSTFESIKNDFIKNNESIYSVIQKQDDRITELNDRIKNFEEIKSRMDDGIIMMTQKKLLSLIEQKIESFEGNIENKMSGLMIYVNDKLSFKNHAPDTELLKKLARLEELKDAIEHRRSTEDILKKRDELKSCSSYDTSKCLEIIDWILGKNNGI